MFKMIKSYFVMKKNEWKIKAKIYSSIATFMDNQNEIIDTFTKLFESLKDANADEIKELLVKELAQIVHDSNNNGNE